MPASSAHERRRLPAAEVHATGKVFEVDFWVDRLGTLLDRWPRQALWLGNLETRLFDAEIEGIVVDRPIYVAGLARSGSTILLEALSHHSETVSHRYRDFPPVLSPILWNRLLDRVPRRPPPASERAHQDGIKVTPESPEAFEEVIWMAFFDDLHDPTMSDLLDGATQRPAFERFYRDHIRKLLWLRGGRRYVSKGNYNVVRLEYLLKLFPDARMLVPVRDPLWHVASMVKQHALFCTGENQESRAQRHLERSGHFEFGFGRRPINAGDPAMARRIMQLWADGYEIEGWARYWDHIYRFLADRMENNKRLRAATLVVRYEELCQTPRDTLSRIFAHCGLDVREAELNGLARGFKHPTYYEPRFTASELEVIARCTRNTAARFGYDVEIITDRQRRGKRGQASSS